MAGCKHGQYKPDCLIDQWFNGSLALRSSYIADAKLEL
jgi:hypothetical protein